MNCIKSEKHFFISHLAGILVFVFSIINSTALLHAADGWDNDEYQPKQPERVESNANAFKNNGRLGFGMVLAAREGNFQLAPGLDLFYNVPFKLGPLDVDILTDLDVAYAFNDEGQYNRFGLNFNALPALRYKFKVVEPYFGLGMSGSYFIGVDEEKLSNFGMILQLGSRFEWKRYFANAAMKYHFLKSKFEDYDGNVYKYDLEELGFLFSGGVIFNSFFVEPGLEIIAIKPEGGSYSDFGESRLRLSFRIGIFI